MLLTEARQLLHEHMVIAGRSPNTVTAYDTDIDAVSVVLAADAGCAVSDLTVDHLTGAALRTAFATWAAQQPAKSTKKRRSDAAVARARAAWTALTGLLVADSVLDADPMGAVPRPKTSRPSPKPLPGLHDGALDRVVVAAREGARGGRNPWPQRDLAAIALLLLTGGRRSEVIALNRGSITGGHGERVVHVIGKGNKARAIAVPDTIDEVLANYEESRRCLFPKWKPAIADPLLVSTPPPGVDTKPPGGIRLTGHQLYYLADQVLTAAGLPAGVREPGALIHAFRHTYATLLVDSGAAVTEVSELLGHSSIATTQHYVQASAQGLRAAANTNPAAALFRTPE
jgi:site-specific recombinase XerD